MRRLWAALAAMMAVAPGTAAAADWGPVGGDSGQKVYVDSGSVRPQGADVTFWTRTDYDPPRMNTVLKARVASLLQQRIDNCADRTLSIASTIYRDADGATVHSAEYPPSDRPRKALIPGSEGDLTQQRACALAIAKTTLKPQVIDSPDAGNWRPLGDDDAGTSSYALKVDEISLLRDTTLLIILKTERAGGVTDGGIGFRTAVSFVATDCVTARADIISSDYYASDGALVAQDRKEVGEIKLADMSAGSAADRAREAACGIWRRDPQSVRTAGAADDAGGLVSGTGWLVTKGYLVTAAHVVAGAGAISLAQDGKVVGTAQVVASDPANDVAVLRPHWKGAAHAALALRPTPASLGMAVFTLGYPAPDALGVGLKMTAGEVSALTGVSQQTQDDRRYLQVSVPVQPGNSGGPIIDGEGHVVGIVIARLDAVGDQELAQNVNYALKAAYVRSVLAELPDVGGYRVVKPAGGVVQLVAELRDGVFLIVAGKAPTP